MRTRLGISLCLAALALTAVSPSGLEWKRDETGRSAPVQPPSSGRSGFTLLQPTATGVSFTNILTGQRAAENQVRLNGGGVSAGDVDGDGLCDLYFCGLENGNRLYRNLGGWRFIDVTEEAGVACLNQFSTGTAFGDFDGDGDLDLLVAGIGAGVRLFLNDGAGRFTESASSGLSRRFGSMTLALADIDADGDLDLYVANYRTSTIRSTGFAVLNIGGKRVIRPEDRDRLEYTPEGLVLEHGEPDFLYLNDGHAKFAPVSWTDGRFTDENGQPLARPPRDWALTAAFRDVNGDLAPDLYISNDFHSPDRLWINDGRGRFREADLMAIRHTPTFSMAVDFADIDRDGHDDFLTLDMLERTHEMRLRNMAMNAPNPPAIGEGLDRPQIDRNTLQLNRGDGTYADIAQYAGLEATGWSWSLLFLDVDLDGYEDVLLTTGNLFNTQDLDANARIAAHGPFRREMIPSKLLMYPSLPQPRLVFRNKGDLTFEESGERWGFNQVGAAHGIALADLDNDGDLDLAVNNLNTAAGLYRNESGAARVGVRLRAAGQNTRGIGAKIKVLGGPVAQSQEMIGAGRYLSCDDAMRVFAGNQTNDLRIEVAWPGGKRTVIERASSNRIYEIHEPAAPNSAVVTEAPAADSAGSDTGLGKASPVWFVDVSAMLNHRHHEVPFDDFARQPLLPNKLSQLGPGASWIDLDGDGWDDLVVGSGKGGQLAAFRNDGQGALKAMTQSPFNQTITRDQTAVLGWRKAVGQTVVLAGSANYEDGLAVGSCVRLYNLESKRIEDTLPGQPSSTGPLALGDMDGDGTLELFVGGRAVAGRYPEPASSLLFRQENDKWALDRTNTAALRGVGLVNGAVWTDLDRDGLPELVLSCEWGPVRIFKTDRRTLRDVTKDWGVDGNLGWWTGIDAADFDGDGRMDLAAANWGLNSPYRASRQFPLRLYYGDLDENGTVDIVEASFDATLNKWAPGRDLNSVLMGAPFVSEQFPSHQSYASAGVSEIYGARLEKARLLEANTLTSMVFLNRGGRFEALVLPKEAQLTPAFGVTAADFDGDGHEDCFLSQNFFATQPNVPRLDAGRGLLLKGDGTGRFQSVPGQESGIKVYGEQRGCASADYDHDGRADLVVTQNGGQTRLFNNRTAKPGLLIKLTGPPGNPDGVGAALQIRSKQRVSPMREVHAGSGYWSLNSPTQIMAAPSDAAELDVYWPGGKKTTVKLPPGVAAVQVGVDGQLSVIEK